MIQDITGARISTRILYINMDIVMDMYKAMKMPKEKNK